MHLARLYANNSFAISKGLQEQISLATSDNCIFLGKFLGEIALVHIEDVINALANVNCRGMVLPSLHHETVDKIHVTTVDGLVENYRIFEHA